MSDKAWKQWISKCGWIIPALITVIWFLVLAWYLDLPFEKGGEKLYWFNKIAAQDPSNFGDFLSGAFAPVAFLWLAYSVLIQRQELAQTREVLEDQMKAQQELAYQYRESNSISYINQVDEKIESLKLEFCALFSDTTGFSLKRKNVNLSVNIFRYSGDFFKIENIYIYESLCFKIINFSKNLENSEFEKEDNTIEKLLIAKEIHELMISISKSKINHDSNAMLARNVYYEVNKYETIAKSLDLIIERCGGSYK
jgi:hypothetical protein